MSGVVLGVDVGGTTTKARTIDAAGNVLAEHRVPTPRDDPGAERLTRLVADLAATAATTHPLEAVGLVVPGVVDDDAGVVRDAVNLGWHGVPVRDLARRALDDRGLSVPVAFGHDVRAGALAETSAHDGTHATLTSGAVAFVPVGTGLASALVVDGRVVSGEGWAGEIGQVRLTTGPHTGRRVEEIASAGAVARRTGCPSARAAADLVRSGDPLAVAVWTDCVAVLAEALAWTAAVTGCHTVVVGGGLAETGELLLGPLRTAVAGRLPGLRTPTLVPARHGDAAGAVGAGLLARAAVRPATDEAHAVRTATTDEPRDAAVTERAVLR